VNGSILVATSENAVERGNDVVSSRVVDFLD